jgi:hypothetical protein
VTSTATLRLILPIHVQSFGRIDEITYLVEKTSALTLPDHGLRDLRTMWFLRPWTFDPKRLILKWPAGPRKTIAARSV